MKTEDGLGESLLRLCPVSKTIQRGEDESPLTHDGLFLVWSSVQVYVEPSVRQCGTTTYTLPQLTWESKTVVGTMNWNELTEEETKKRW